MATGTRVLWRNGRPAGLVLSRCRVRVRDANGEREVVFDGDGSIRVGSGPENDLVLADDTVSRHHARIYREGDRWLVVDLDSTNGTFVHRARVREAYLTPDAVVTMGAAELRVVPAEEEIDIEPSGEARLGDLVGGDRQMRELYTLITKVAPTDATVVLEGETGTGKDVVARTIQRLSSRAEGPMVVFDCGAVAPALIESELFGHVRGAFTGATADRAGVFELADGGTIFLDEIGELPLELQPKLLRALETREVRRVGASKPTRVSVRVIAATHRDLERAVRTGQFRSDLFYRLSVVRLRVPPLRERAADIPILVKHFLDRGSFNRGPNGERLVDGVDRDALRRLAAHDWPGNVRELLNAIEHAVSLSDGPMLRAGALPSHVGRGAPSAARPSAPPPAGAPLGAKVTDELRVQLEGTYRVAKERVVEAFERAFIQNLLARHGPNISAAARDADMDRKHLRKLLRRYGALDTPDDDSDD